MMFKVLVLTGILFLSCKQSLAENTPGDYEKERAGAGILNGCSLFAWSPLEIKLGEKIIRIEQWPRAKFQDAFFNAELVDRFTQAGRVQPLDVSWQDRLFNSETALEDLKIETECPPPYGTCPPIDSIPIDHTSGKPSDPPSAWGYPQ